MNIAVIGSGNMGSGLGKIWAEKGHRIFFSFSRDIEKLKALAGSAPNAQASTPADAVKQSEVVLMSVKWQNIKEAVKACGSLKGKVLIDCTNPLKPDMSGLAAGYETSGAEEIAKLAKDAHVVKAFNTIFAETYHTRSRLFGTRIVSMLFCGDDEKAKSVVEQLIRQVGFDPVDAGSLKIARYLEPMAMLMIHLGYVRGMGTNMVMSLTRR